MRSRTIREGSVGLLILLGIAVFGGLVLWLRGFTPGSRSYKFVANFPDTVGMQVGAPVRYRGVPVGRITDIAAGSNGVAVTIEIIQPDLAIPRNPTIEANQSGLIGETSIDIRPPKIRTERGEQIDIILPADLATKPLDANCESANVIICNNDVTTGQKGVNLYDLLTATTRLSEVYSSPEFKANLNAATKNGAEAAKEIANLSREFTLLGRSLRQELRTFSTTAISLSASANRTSNEIGLMANQIADTADRFGNTADKFGNTADRINQTIGDFGGTTAQINQTIGKFGGTADRLNQTIDRLGGRTDEIVATINKFGQTADKFNLLATNLNSLVGDNKATLTATLNNFSEASKQLSETLGALKPTLTKIDATFAQVNTGEIVRNLESVTANAAQISNNLRDLSANLNDPKNLVTLQQTLDSARATFENTQKITADLDELTGDPAFRDNLKNLVNGLGKLVSSTDRLQQQVQTAQVLESVEPTSDRQTLTFPLNNTFAPSANLESTDFRF
jgi:phospholipid/cholesterol/gamma-HCH transport system substrate-binding protein